LAIATVKAGQVLELSRRHGQQLVGVDIARQLLHDRDDLGRIVRVDRVRERDAAQWASWLSGTLCQPFGTGRPMESAIVTFGPDACPDVEVGFAPVAADADAEVDVDVLDDFDSLPHPPRPTVSEMAATATPMAAADFFKSPAGRVPPGAAKHSPD
jgi:hypothetical protein